MKTDRYESQIKLRSCVAGAYSQDSFTASLSYMFKSSALSAVFERAVKYFRRFRIIRTVFTVITFIVTFLGTGVAFLAVTAVFFVILPVTALLCFAVVFISLFQRNRDCRMLNGVLDGRTVRVFFPARDSDFSDSAFLRGMCLEAAGDGGAAIVVTPHLLGSRGIGGKTPFLTVRREYENVYTVRRYVFFTLRRRVLDKNTENCVYFM